MFSYNIYDLHSCTLYLLFSLNPSFDLTGPIYPEKAEGTFTNLENLYRLNEITKLPYAAAQLTEKALICEVIILFLFWISYIG